MKAAGYKVAASYAGNDEAANKFKTETGINVYKWDVSSYDACVEGLKKVEADPDWKNTWCAAIAYVGLGQNDEAIRSLETDLENGGSRGGMRVTGMRWEFDPLRSDPRFQRLLKRGEEPY